MNKKKVTIKIVLTNDNITLDGNNLEELTEDDIIGSIKVLVSFAKIMYGWQDEHGEGVQEDGNA